MNANLIGDIALILDTILFEKIFGDRRRQTSYQGIVEQLRSFHRKAVSVTFEMINIKVLREDQFADEKRKACLLRVVEKRFLDIESQPTVGSNELHGIEARLATLEVAAESDNQRRPFLIRSLGIIVS